MTDNKTRAPVSLNVLQPYPDDELSLYELWAVLKAGKKLFFVTACCVLLVVALYVLLAPRVYESTVYLMPPNSRDVQPLNVEIMAGVDGPVRQYSPQDVYKVFLDNLSSHRLRMEFFRQQSLEAYFRKSDEPTEAEIFEKDFNEKLVVTLPDKKKESEQGIITFEMDDPERLAEWLNGFVSLVEQRTLDDLAADIAFSLQTRIEYLKRDIAGKRQKAFDRRQDQILRLTEAAQVARDLNIVDRMDLGLESPTASGFAINTADIPLYMRGSKALEAEIEVLKKRESDDPFIGGLRDLEEKLVELQQLSLDKSRLSVVKVDKSALVPYEVKSPKVLLIGAIGIVLAGVLGVMVVFLAHGFLTSKKKMTTT